MLLQDARVKRGFTQVELAERAGISQGHISLLENGHRFVGPDIAKRIEEALNLEVDWVRTRLKNSRFCSGGYENPEPEDTVLNYIWDYAASAVSMKKRLERVAFLRLAVEVLENFMMKGAKAI
ncbi:hypothetical protein SDC9_38129 [bioreactor metagenome]|uniref:HTH cro/C1-type domain-containing protein n=1 Tax=bioreactor metagenome TaxID=1076179 RepID=A0A644VL13_9ZZZZ